MVTLNKRVDLGRKLTWNEMDANWTNIQNFFAPINITYAELAAAIDDAALEPGHYYLLTDFATSHYIQYTDSSHDGTGGDEVVNTAPVEPLLLLATDSHTLDLEARSVNFPQDIIHYQVAVADRNYEYAASVGKGCIIKRIDTLTGNSRDYDFRAVKFRRWETAPENEIFTSYLYVAGSAYQDFLCQNIATPLLRVKIYSPLSTYADYGGHYWLDNVVIQTGVNHMTDFEGMGINTTFSTGNFVENNISLFNNLAFTGVNFSMNNIKSILNTIVTGDMQLNMIGELNNNHIGQLLRNECQSITGNTLGSGPYFNITDNKCTNIQDNGNLGDISGNIVDQIVENTNGGQISGNVCDIIAGNTNPISGDGYGDIYDNLAATIVNNTNAGYIKCLNINDCTGNSGNGSIANLIGFIFTNNTLTFSVNKCLNVNINGMAISAAINNHVFLSEISAGPDFTVNPTAMMQGPNPTVSRYDIGTGHHHEEILSGGSLSYSAAITA